MLKYHYLLSVIAISFLLGIHEGNVALWKTGETGPIYVSSVKASSLPASDQERLSIGIPVEDEAALRQLLEDYLS